MKYGVNPAKAGNRSFWTPASAGVTAWALWMFLVAPAQAALTLPDVLNRMEQAQRDLADVRFNFEQRVQHDDFPEQRVTGEAWVMRPHLLRVEQKTPAKQVLTTDGVTFWLYTPAQQQQLKGNWPAWLKRSGFPLPIMDFVGTFTPEQWRTQYKVYFGGYRAHEYELRFKPIDPGVQPLTLWISEDTFLPARGRLSGEGYRMDVTLSRLQTNTGLQESLFAPQAPSGTEEIPVTF